MYFYVFSKLWFYLMYDWKKNLFCSDDKIYGDFLGYEIYEFICKFKDVYYGLGLVYSMWV